MGLIQMVLPVYFGVIQSYLFFFRFCTLARGPHLVVAIGRVNFALQEIDMLKIGLRNPMIRSICSGGVQKPLGTFEPDTASNIFQPLNIVNTNMLSEQSSLIVAPNHRCFLNKANPSTVVINAYQCLIVRSCRRLITMREYDRCNDKGSKALEAQMIFCTHTVPSGLVVEHSPDLTPCLPLSWHPRAFCWLNQVKSQISEFRDSKLNFHGTRCKRQTKMLPLTL